MSLVNVKEQDELVQCPYDPAHRVRAIRFTRHLIKCQRNSSADLAPCPFNHQHRIPVKDRASHMITCPDKIVVERDVFRDQDSGGDCGLPPLVFPTIPSPSDEDWDAACMPGEGPAYNPLLKMKKAQFHNPAILSSMKPVDKRAYRKELQTKRFGDEIDESFDDSVDLVPILGLKKLAFPDEDVKGFYPRPAPRRLFMERQMSSNVSEPSGVTPRRNNVHDASLSMGYDSNSQCLTSGPGSFTQGSQSFTSGAVSYNSSGPRSVSSDQSSFNDSFMNSDTNSVQFRSSHSVQSSGSSAIFSLRGKGRGLRFEKHLPDVSKY